MSSEHHLQLLRLIESQVLPRLLQSLGSTAQHEIPPAIGESGSMARADSTEGVRRFAQVLSRGDPATIDATLRELMDAGIPLGSIFLRVLAPAARHLCDRWERRECSFHEVATGLIQLLAVLRRLREPQH